MSGFDVSVDEKVYEKVRNVFEMLKRLLKIGYQTREKKKIE